MSHECPKLHNPTALATASGQKDLVPTLVFAMMMDDVDASNDVVVGTIPLFLVLFDLGVTCSFILSVASKCDRMSKPLSCMLSVTTPTRDHSVCRFL